MTGTAVVIDDSPDMAYQLAAIIGRLGLRVVAVCENGPQGLTALRRHKPTLATIDNQLPGMSGIEIVRAACAESLAGKVVLCTGTAQRHMQDQARAAGAHLFITKPYDQVLVERALKNLLGG